MGSPILITFTSEQNVLGGSKENERFLNIARMSFSFGRKSSFLSFSRYALRGGQYKNGKSKGGHEGTWSPLIIWLETHGLPIIWVMVDHLPSPNIWSTTINIH